MVFTSSCLVLFALLRTWCGWWRGPPRTVRRSIRGPWNSAHRTGAAWGCEEVTLGDVLNMFFFLCFKFEAVQKANLYVFFSFFPRVFCVGFATNCWVVSVFFPICLNHPGTSNEHYFLLNLGFH